MPARDVYHETVRNALVKEGWTITHDPLRLPWGGRDLYVDLGAERLIAAEKAGEKIAVEVKSFLGPSEVAELEKAVGQYVLYNAVLKRRDPERVLFLAVPKTALANLFDDSLGDLLLEDGKVRVFGFDPVTEELLWNL